MSGVKFEDGFAAENKWVLITGTDSQLLQNSKHSHLIVDSEKAYWDRLEASMAYIVRACMHVHAHRIALYSIHVLVGGSASHQEALMNY